MINTEKEFNFFTEKKKDEVPASDKMVTSNKSFLKAISFIGLFCILFNVYSYYDAVDKIQAKIEQSLAFSEIMFQIKDHYEKTGVIDFDKLKNFQSYDTVYNDFMLADLVMQVVFRAENSQIPKVSLYDKSKLLQIYEGHGIKE